MDTIICRATYNSYLRGCRCAECKSANAAYQRERRKIRKASIAGDEWWHGTSGGATNHACHCERCVRAICNSSRAWEIANREKANARARRYRKANPEPSRLAARLRRARVAGVATIRFTKEELQQKWDYYGGRCYLCGNPADCTDHVKPITKGGPHMLANLKPACNPCNIRKRDKWPYGPVAASLGSN